MMMIQSFFALLSIPNTDCRAEGISDSTQYLHFLAAIFIISHLIYVVCALSVHYESNRNGFRLTEKIMLIPTLLITMHDGYAYGIPWFICFWISVRLVRYWVAVAVDRAWIACGRCAAIPCLWTSIYASAGILSLNVSQQLRNRLNLRSTNLALCGEHKTERKWNNNKSIFYRAIYLIVLLVHMNESSWDDIILKFVVFFFIQVSASHVSAVIAVDKQMQWVWKCAIIITNTPRISWVYNWKTAARTSLGNPKVISLSLSAMCVFSFFPLWRVAGTRSGVVAAKQFFRNANNRDALRCVKAQYLGPRCVRVLFYYIHSHQRSISRANWNMKIKNISWKQMMQSLVRIILNEFKLKPLSNYNFVTSLWYAEWSIGEQRLNQKLNFGLNCRNKPQQGNNYSFIHSYALQQWNIIQHTLNVEHHYNTIVPQQTSKKLRSLFIDRPTLCLCLISAERWTKSRYSFSIHSATLVQLLQVANMAECLNKLHEMLNKIFTGPQTFRKLYAPECTRFHLKCTWIIFYSVEGIWLVGW